MVERPERPDRADSRGPSREGGSQRGRGGSRGGRRGNRGGDRGGRGGHGSNGHGHHHGHSHRENDQEQDEPREKKPFVPWLGEARPGKGPILDLEQFVDHELDVQFGGGRQIKGRLTGFDHVTNLVLEDVVEYLGPDRSRKLGKLVALGAQIQSIAPVGGSASV